MNVRVNLLAIFVLSICSNYALAQFDTVINLPENPDSPNPSGFSGNSIGGSSGISSNTQLNVSDGGSIASSFDAGDASSTNVEVNISGGTVGSSFDAFGSSTVNISGGTVGSNFNAFFSTVDISGGTVGSDFFALGSTVNISGGTVGSNFDAVGGSTVNITGGAFGNDFNVAYGSTVNLFGTEFFLNGSLIDASTLGEPFTICLLYTSPSPRDATLSRMPSSA